MKDGEWMDGVYFGKEVRTKQEKKKEGKVTIFGGQGERQKGKKGNANGKVKHSRI